RLQALEQLRLRASWLVGLALAAQIVIISVAPQGDRTVHHVVHLSTYALTAAFALLNRRVAGVGLAAVGGLLNLAAITSNGGVMPASASALRIAGFTSPGSGFANSAAVAHAHLAWLGDVFALPASWPVHNVFSVGDVLLGAGVAVLIVVAMRRPSPAADGHDTPAASGDHAGAARQLPLSS
ncbi:MAG TPA: DUF5317 domain-containing protein, partial [Candidatus Limnocylindrales bacterium]|nr:DUF5317 domain-containing protein [Candidatus Limnocylindrales bacterium]